MMYRSLIEELESEIRDEVREILTARGHEWDNDDVDREVTLLNMKIARLLIRMATA